MKNLQKNLEHSWHIQTSIQLQGMKKEVQNPQQIILLLHGLGERGKRIFRKLCSYLPSNALIIAPNGPYPLIKNTSPLKQAGYSWYYSDIFPKKTSCELLKTLIEKENKKKVPLSIIGFSQGGYLAPHVGQMIKETQMIIGIGCEFRASSLVHHDLSHQSFQDIKKDFPFKFIGLHGEDDKIVSFESAKKNIEDLKKFGLKTEFISVPRGQHHIDEEMGHLVASYFNQ